MEEVLREIEEIVRKIEEDDRDFYQFSIAYYNPDFSQDAYVLKLGDREYVAVRDTLENKYFIFPRYKTVAVHVLPKATKTEQIDVLERLECLAKAFDWCGVDRDTLEKFITNYFQIDEIVEIDIPEDP